MFTYSSFQNRKVLSGIDCFEQFVRAHQETTTHGRLSVASNIRDWCPPILKLIWQLCFVLFWRQYSQSYREQWSVVLKPNMNGFLKHANYLQTCFLHFEPPPSQPASNIGKYCFFSGCFSLFKQQWMLVKRSLFGNKVSGSVKDWQMFHLANSIS